MLSRSVIRRPLLLGLLGPMLILTSSPFLILDIDLLAVLIVYK